MAAAGPVHPKGEHARYRLVILPMQNMARARRKWANYTYESHIKVIVTWNQVQSLVRSPVSTGCIGEQIDKDQFILPMQNMAKARQSGRRFFRLTRYTIAGENRSGEQTPRYGLEMPCHTNKPSGEVITPCNLSGKVALPNQEGCIGCHIETGRSKMALRVSPSTCFSQDSVTTNADECVADTLSMNSK